MTLERHHWRRSGVFIDEFENVNADWVNKFLSSTKLIANHIRYLEPLSVMTLYTSVCIPNGQNVSCYRHYCYWYTKLSF